MIQSLLPKEEEEKLKAIFFDLDKNGCGQLDQNELKKELSNIYGRQRAESIVQRIFHTIDRDNSGKISFEEFKLGFVEKQLLL